jgi:hypothetical protein
MKNMKKLVAMMLMLVSVFFFACDDDEPDPLSPERAKTALSDLSTQMSTDFSDMQETEGMTAMQALMNMPDPFADPSKANTRFAVIPNIYESLIPFSKEIKTKATYLSEGFDFDAHKGSYTWNNSTQSWTIVLGGNTIIINFPSDENNMGVNDAKLTISNYTEDINYNPTAISAKLEVNNIKIVEITFSATWNTDDSPKSLNVEIFLKPFTFAGGFEQTSSTAAVNFSILYNNTRIFAASLNVTFTDTTRDVLKKVSGFIQYRDIKITASVNIANIISIIEQVDAGTSPYATIDEALNAINKEIDAKVTKDGALVAKIKLGIHPTEGISVMLEFSNGSEELAQPYFESFIASLEEFFDFIGSYFDKEGK